MTFKDLLDNGVKFLVVVGSDNTGFYQVEGDVVHAWMENVDGTVWSVYSGSASNFATLSYEVDFIPDADWIC